MPPILGIVFLAEAFEGSDVHQQRWTNIVAQVTAPVTDGGLGMTRRQANAFYTQAVNSICGVLFERSFSPASINQEAFYLFVWKLLYASFSFEIPSELEDQLADEMANPTREPPASLYRTYFERVSAVQTQLRTEQQKHLSSEGPREGK